MDLELSLDLELLLDLELELLLDLDLKLLRDLALEFFVDLVLTLFSAFCLKSLVALEPGLDSLCSFPDLLFSIFPDLELLHFGTGIREARLRYVWYTTK